jgi:PAS domain S-box-containing protein
MSKREFPIMKIDPSAGFAASGSTASDEADLFRTVFDHFPDMVQCVAPDASFLYVNRAWRETLGYSEEECRRLNFFAVIHPNSQAQAQAVFDRTTAGESLSQVEFAMASRDGRAIFVEGSMTIRYARERPIGTLGIFRDVTARRQAEESLRQERDFLAAVLDSSRLLVLVLDKQGNIVRMNKAGESTTGYPLSEVQGKPVWHFLAIPEESQLIQQAFERLDGGFPKGLVHHWQIKDGGQRLIEWTTDVVRSKDNTIDHISCTGVDITERERAEFTLRESDSRHRLLLEQVPAVLWTTDRDLRFTTGIGAGLSHLGLKPGGLQMVGLSLFTYFHSDDPQHPNIAPHFRAMAGEKAEWDSEWLGRTFHSVVEPLRDAQEDIIGTIGIALDITERRQAEQALQRSEEFLVMSQQAGQCGSWEWDFESNRIKWSEEMYRIHGVTPETFGGTMEDVVAFIHPKDLPAVRDRMALISQGKDFSSPSFRIVRPDGETRTVLARGAVLRDEAGRPRRAIGTVMDVTDQHRTELALQQQQEFMQRVTDLLPVYWYVFDLEKGAPVSANRDPLEFLGYPVGTVSPKDVIGQLMHPEDQQKFAAHAAQLHEAADGEVLEFEYRMRRSTGEWGWFVSRDMPFARADDGSVKLIIGTAWDITDRKHAEDQIRASLQEKGVMLREIHHRVKNNLQVIQSLLSLQANRMKEPIAQEMLREAYNRVRAMATTHDQLYQTPDLARVDVARQVKEIALPLLRSYGADSQRISLTVEVPADARLPLTQAIPTGLILNELLANALRHAFPDNRAGMVRVGFHEDPPGNCSLIVGDNGISISPDVNLARPTSLGMQIVRSLVEQLRGTLTVDRVGGTEWRITFPKAK